MKKWIITMLVAAFTGLTQGQTIIDAWYYDGVADSTLLNGANCGSVSNINASGYKWKHNGTPAVVSNTMQRWEGDFSIVAGVTNNTESSAFKNINPSSSANANSGIFEFSYAIESADFSNTAVSNGSANVLYCIRGASSGNAHDTGVRLRYEGGLNVTNIVNGSTNTYADADHIQLQVRTGDLGNWGTIVNMPGSSVSDIALHTRYDIDNETVDTWYMSSGGSVSNHLYSGTLESGFVLAKIRQAIQSGNGNNSWRQGDVVVIGDIELSKLAEPGPPPATSIVDFWDFEGLNDGDGLSQALSIGYVGNVAFSDASMCSVSNLPSGNGVIVFNPTGAANESVFRTAAPSTYGGSSTGIYEFAFDVPYMDWSLTQGVDSNANVGFEIRNDANPREPMTVQVKYIGNEGTDEIRLDYTDDVGTTTMLTIPGAIASNLGVRCVFNLDDAGNAGSAQFYYTKDGVEVAATYDATVSAALNFEEYRVRAQALNGGNGWQIGDKVFFDNLRVEKIATMPVEPVYADKVDYQMNDADGTLLNALAQTGTDGGQFTGTESNIAANGLGSLEILGNGTNDVYRQHLLDVAYTSGLHRLEFAFDDWNLNASEEGSKVQFGLMSEDGLNNVQFGIDVNTNNGTVRFRAVANNGGGSGQDFYDYAGYVSSTGVVLRIDANLDAGIYNAFWRYDNQTEDDFVTVVGGGSLGGLSNIAQIRLTLNAASTTGMDLADYVNVDYLVYSTTSDQAPPTATELWNEWLATYPLLGTSTNFSDNSDGDDYDNLSEYYYGGNPTVGESIDNTPALGDQVSDGGTNYILYVFSRRQDQAARGLSNTIELRDMLMFGSWTNDTDLYEFVGAGDVDDTWRSVTNRVNAEADERFIRNRINYTP